ncbi:MAG: hypothetical protein OXU77_00635, partial [Gammaproteobacteria bacterium]|nr:hypothetical protein [Gammaproteobacteria bacterium]
LASSCELVVRSGARESTNASIMVYQVRREVWYSIWDAQTLQRYYQELARENQKKAQRMTRWLVVTGLATTVTALAAWVEGISALVPAVVSIALTVITLMMHFGQYADKAVTAHQIAHRCGELNRDLERLLRDMDRYLLDQSQAEQDYRKARNGLDNVTSNNGAIVTNPRRYNEIAEETKKMMEVAHA